MATARFAIVTGSDNARRLPRFESPQQVVLFEEFDFLAPGAAGAPAVIFSSIWLKQETLE